MRQPFQWHEYGIETKIFDDSSYFINQIQPPIYDVYFYCDYVDNDIINNDNNGTDVAINGVLIDKLEVECKGIH